MAFTYAAGSTTDRNRVRFQLGDTDRTRALFNDAEIDDLLAQESDVVLGAAALGCEILATRFARDFTFSADGSRFEKQKVGDAYAARARQLRQDAVGSTVQAPTPKDGYSDDIDTSESDSLNGQFPTFDQGRFSSKTGRLERR